MLATRFLPWCGSVRHCLQRTPDGDVWKDKEDREFEARGRPSLFCFVLLTAVAEHVAALRNANHVCVAMRLIQGSHERRMKTGSGACRNRNVSAAMLPLLVSEANPFPEPH